MTTCPQCGSEEALALLTSVECPVCDGPDTEVEEYPDYEGVPGYILSFDDDGEASLTPSAMNGVDGTWFVYNLGAEDPCESSD